MKTNLSTRGSLVYLSTQVTITLAAGAGWQALDFSADVPEGALPLLHMNSAGRCGIRPTGDLNNNDFATGGVGDWEHIAPGRVFEGFWDGALGANYILVGYIFL